MREMSIIEAVVKRDRMIVIAGIVIILLLAWLYILLGAGTGNSIFEMTSLLSSTQSAETMPEMDMTSEMDMEPVPAMMMQVAVWTPAHAGLMLLMWWVMMIAMMLPSASPMILLFATVNRKQRSQGAPFVPTGVFVAGYLAVWALYSLTAVIVQWSFEWLGLLSAMMASTNGILSGFVLLLAGIYQLTPLKHACLSQCRSPMQFITQYWCPGTAGAFRMGVVHGTICLGCCWALMALLFVGGVMNLYLIVALALLVLFEKTVPAGNKLSIVMGIGLLLWGGWALMSTI